MLSGNPPIPWQRPARTFLRLPVRLGDVSLGRVSDVVLGDGLDRVVGFVLEGRDGLSLFLPWVAASPERDRISIGSVFALLSGPELDFYLANGIRLGEAPDQALQDALVDESGALRPVEHRP
jgi:hypothetical protein